GIHERREVAERAEHVALRTYLKVALSHGQALRFLGALFAFNFGFAAVIPFLTPFLTTDIHLTDQVAIALAALTLLVTAGTRSRGVALPIAGVQSGSSLSVGFFWSWPRSAARSFANCPRR